MLSTPEKDKIDSKRMCVEAMTERGEVSFSEECKRLLDLRNEIGTKGNKKHAKSEAKERLKNNRLFISFGFVEQLYKPWLPNLDKTLQPRYIIETETCKYSSILRSYTKWYIAILNLKKETTNPNEMKIKDELVLQGMTQASAEYI